MWFFWSWSFNSFQGHQSYLFEHLQGLEVWDFTVTVGGSWPVGPQWWCYRAPQFPHSISTWNCQTKAFISIESDFMSMFMIPNHTPWHLSNKWCWKSVAHVSSGYFTLEGEEQVDVQSQQGRVAPSFCPLERYRKSSSPVDVSSEISFIYYCLMINDSWFQKNICSCSFLIGFIILIPIMYTGIVATLLLCAARSINKQTNK